jgi:hypothetical protein
MVHLLERFAKLQTFQWVAIHRLPPRPLGDNLRGFLITAPQFLYPLVVVVDGNTQHLLCAVLTDDELI